MDTNGIRKILPSKVADRVAPYFDALDILTAVDDPKVLASLGPAGVRGLILQRGKQGIPTLMPASHSAYFDWTYPQDQPEMRELYRRAKQNQWDGETWLP